MDRLLFIETFVLGAAVIACIYHFVLFVQQRDKFLLFYSLYLFTLACYISFKLISNNYSPFLPNTIIYYNFIEELLQVIMVAVYATFAAVTLEITKTPGPIKTGWILFLVFALLSIIFQFIKNYYFEVTVTSVVEYGISRFSLIAMATVSLLLAWKYRTSTFQRTIIIGSFVYDFSGLLSALSFVFGFNIFNLSGVEPYLLGCLIDIVIFSAAFGYRIKMVALQKNELLKNKIAVADIKNQIAQDLHDDIGSTLSSMQIYGEIILKNFQAKPAQSEELLNKIVQQSKGLMTRMGDIVWSLKTVEAETQSLTVRLANYSAELLASKNIITIFDVDDHLISTIYNPEVRKNILLISKEAMNNIAKYSGATTTVISFKKHESSFQLTISDNGKGFDINTINIGNGLNNIKSRCAKLEGNCTIDSVQGKGVVVTCYFPIAIISYKG